VPDGLEGARLEHVHVRAAISGVHVAVELVVGQAPALAQVRILAAELLFKARLMLLSFCSKSHSRIFLFLHVSW